MKYNFGVYLFISPSQTIWWFGPATWNVVDFIETSVLWKTGVDDIEYGIKQMKWTDFQSAVLARERGLLYIHPDKARYSWLPSSELGLGPCQHGWITVCHKWRSTRPWRLWTVYHFDFIFSCSRPVAVDIRSRSWGPDRVAWCRWRFSYYYIL